MSSCRLLRQLGEGFGEPCPLHFEILCVPIGVEQSSNDGISVGGDDRKIGAIERSARDAGQSAAAADDRSAPEACPRGRSVQRCPGGLSVLSRRSRSVHTETTNPNPAWVRREQ